MLDFSPFWNKEKTLNELTAHLTQDDLRNLMNEMTDTILGLIVEGTDADVVFQPVDPDAHDPSAASDNETDLAWTLGHVIVHVTAGNEESAALAAELARGVEFHGRSRSEVPWETMQTIAQCRERLEESRRMCLASLGMWPDQPHLDNTHEPFPTAGQVNAVGRYVVGLLHANMHLEQIAEIMRQARAARA